MTISVDFLACQTRERERCHIFIIYGLNPKMIGMKFITVSVSKENEPAQESQNQAIN